MAEVRPFPGLRFNPKRVSLGAGLCPPYDVIAPEEAIRLRRTPGNAVHLELPEGEGRARYDAAAGLWRRWQEAGLLLRDSAPCLYVCEEKFAQGGRTRRRVGFLAALGVKPESAASILAHERTLAKPKEDRLNLLAAVRANISPIFGVFPDDAGVVRRVLACATRRKPTAAGRTAAGVAYRLWALDDAAAAARIRKAMAAKSVLIADGHHRFEVSKEFYRQSPSEGSSTVLAYLCPEQDSGLIVLPTHRIVSNQDLGAKARATCRPTPCASLLELLKKLEKSGNPYAFGLCEGGSFTLCEPKRALGCKSRLCVEWIGRHLLGDVPPEQIRYTPDAGKAWALSEEAAGSAVLVKPFPVARIRKAVAAVGLLPPKSTYFFPKIATGLVFKAL